jgi:hypothetical protein
MLGTYRRAGQHVCYLGCVERRRYHIVTVADNLFLLCTVGDMWAKPISKDELERIESHLV